jgi:hypothetical protein
LTPTRATIYQLIDVSCHLFQELLIVGVREVVVVEDLIDVFPDDAEKLVERRAEGDVLFVRLLIAGEVEPRLEGGSLVARALFVFAPNDVDLRLYLATVLAGDELPVVEGRRDLRPLWEKLPFA